ncbi:beta-propeller fold lactonase family protein [Sinorhizobium medicae]|nr:beta-propeller fold lactonase family protein [Sinorhizobium medicae]
MELHIPQCHPLCRRRVGLDGLRPPDQSGRPFGPVPSPFVFTGQLHRFQPCALVLSPDGARLHVSNRGHDSICTFDVVDGGRLASPSWTGSNGRTPRFTCYNPEGTGLLVANEESDTIVSLPSGGSGPAVLVARTTSPNCNAFRGRALGKLSAPTTRLKPIEEGATAMTAVSTGARLECRSSSASSCWRVPSLSRLMPTASKWLHCGSVPPQFHTS